MWEQVCRCSAARQWPVSCQEAHSATSAPLPVVPTPTYVTQKGLLRHRDWRQAGRPHRHGPVRWCVDWMGMGQAMSQQEAALSWHPSLPLHCPPSCISQPHTPADDTPKTAEVCNGKGERGMICDERLPASSLPASPSLPCAALPHHPTLPPTLPRITELPPALHWRERHWGLQGQVWLDGTEVTHAFAPTASAS